jgi:hypothetical protein
MWMGKIKIKMMPWSIIMGKWDIQWLILGLQTNPYLNSLLPHHSITERKPLLCLLPATYTEFFPYFPARGHDYLQKTFSKLKDH